MKLSVILFSLAAFFSGATWWAHIVGEAGSGGLALMELIQLGGTGGLILSLLGAVIALWKERTLVKEEWKKEVEILRTAITNERTEHRKEIADMRAAHQENLTELSNKYTEELKNQINILRKEERQISDERYGRGD